MRKACSRTDFKLFSIKEVMKILGRLAQNDFAGTNPTDSLAKRRNPYPEKRSTAL
jgi:hypothetical protein